MVDQHFNLTGKWKRTAMDRHWALKAEFQIAPQQNGIVFAGDYKGPYRLLHCLQRLALSRVLTATASCL